MPAPSLHMTSQLPNSGDLSAGPGAAEIRLATPLPLTPDQWLSLPGRPVAAEHIGQPELRLAAVDALDRWLQLPVDEALVRAERAVVRAEVADHLASGSRRSALLDDAIALARAAQPGLERFLEQVTLPMPDELLRSVGYLINGVAALAEQAPDADDLRDVAKAGDRVLRSRPAPAPGRQPRVAGIDDEYVGDRTADRLDPRLLPARVVRFSDDPTLGEIRRTKTEISRIPVLQVEVLAAEHPDDRPGDRLYARFVDTRTGRVQARLLLTRSHDVFSASLPVDESVDPDHLRVEIVDTEFDRPPATGGSADAELIGLRRSAVQLRRRRLLVSYHRLGIVAERELLRAVRSVSGDSAATVEELDGEAGAPLVAELAYAYAIGIAQDS
jgi:hypothetical protein